MVYVWMKLSLNNITEPTRFHAYVVIVVWLLWLPWQCMLFNLRICVWTILYAIVWILLKTCCCINLSLCIVDYSASSLWCHSACVFLSGCILLQAFKGHTSFSLLCVRTPMHLTWLATRSHTCFRQSYHTYLCGLSWSRHYFTTHYWDSYSKQYEV